jgi:P-loop Domain of unknown function (DUF2791)
VSEGGPSHIRPRERDAILQSLRAGVVPRAGQQHMQVGRINELNAMVADIARVVEGGSTIRFVIGEYGSGKTFFLMLVRAIALQERLVTVHADLSPDRRLQGSGGQARSLYAELVVNMSTRAKPDGGALQSVVERFVSSAVEEAASHGIRPDAVIATRLESLRELVGGFDFATVIKAYWEGAESGNDETQANAVRWLRGEFLTKTDARAALGVRTIIDDANWYDHLKLLSRFVRLAGYQGLLICLDELVNLYKLANTASRSANYEQLLRILNDSLQGSAAGVGWLLGGTPEFLLDTRRGLYSYQALQSRLEENTFATAGLIDYSGPVLRLANLSPEDFYVLLLNLRNVYAGGDPSKYLLPDEALRAFMVHCSQRIGDAYFRTPRNTIKEFVNFLAVLEQNPGASWAELLGHIEVPEESNPDLAPLADAESEAEARVHVAVGPTDRPEGDDGLSSFRL